MTENNLTPPIAKVSPHEFEHLGKTYTDNYRWLQNKDDPEVIAYLEAENAYAKANLQHTDAFQESLFEELKGRIKEDDSTVPEKRGEYYYYSRVASGQQYRIFCRKHQSLEAEEEIILDENLLAEQSDYCRVNSFVPSPDNTLLAYSVDTTGAFVYTLYVKDLRTGEILTDGIADVAWTIAWASDNQTVFYTLFDDAHRPYKLFRHRVGDVNSDVEVYHETDDAYNIYVERTRSGQYLLMTMQSSTTTEVHYLSADNPTEQFEVVHPRQHWMEYFVYHHGARFLIRTNEDAENFKLMQAPIDHPTKDNWTPLLDHREDVLIEEVDTFQDYLVIYERQGGLQQIRISPPNDIRQEIYVDFPEPVYTFNRTANPEFMTDTLRFYYSSLVTPNSTIDYGMNNGAWEVKKQQEIPSGYDASLYESARIHATAPDGTQVPISLVYRKGISLNGENPLLLYGYGSYGISMDPNFNTSRLSLIDRGFVYAIAHIRGGSEMGRSWYENGRLMHKKNTFTDFIACAEHLIEEKYTSAEHLAIMGGSAGGLLVSAVANMRPELFKAVASIVPFTNVITAMLMPELPLTVIEWEQWGNPENQEAFDYMLSYSPYENIEAKDYPHLYVKAGLNDLQVPYWDPAKYVARLRTQKTDDNRLLFVTNMGAGHHGASGRYDYLREVAEQYAFILDALGLLES